jgi:hypothetical protein
VAAKQLIAVTPDHAHYATDALEFQLDIRCSRTVNASDRPGGAERSSGLMPPSSILADWRGLGGHGRGNRGDGWQFEVLKLAGEYFCPRKNPPTSHSLVTDDPLLTSVHSDYLIEVDGHGGFRVRITDGTGEQTVVPNFSTWQEASEWTEEQLRLEQGASGPVSPHRFHQPSAMPARRPRPARKW